MIALYQRLTPRHMWEMHYHAPDTEQYRTIARNIAHKDLVWWAAHNRPTAQSVIARINLDNGLTDAVCKARHVDVIETIRLEANP